MALTHIVFGDAGDQSRGYILPTFVVTDQMVWQTLTPTTANVASTVQAPDLISKPACLIVTDVAVYAAVSTGSPNATSTSSSAKKFYVPPNVPFSFSCKIGSKVAVTLAS